MATPEEIFNSTRLEVIVPEEGLDVPDESDADDWLRSLAGVKQRDKAFFDERLLLFFTVRTPHPSLEPVNPSAAPPELALFLSHLQVTLDAKYIAPQQPHRSTAPSSARGISLAPPPRSHSYQNNARSPATHPSIFPPYTPHPIPQTDETDRKYASSNSRKDGTVLESYVWGESPREDISEKNFALIWSTSENVWLAAYRLTVGVSFLRTNFSEPLLSLTVSATLREKPLTMTPERKFLAALVSAAGRVPSPALTTPAAVNGISESDVQEDELRGLEEVNLLDGLSQGTTFGGRGAVSLTLPSTRLGASLRRSAYALPPAQPISPKLSSPSTTTSATNTTRSTAPILRKSFLKTLQTVSGFQIRMKSVFVPYVIIPGAVEDEGERREAGSEERTVVLSVELGNGSAFGGPGATGFAVEGVDVTVGGEGAKANLIGWGEDGFQRSDTVFPLLMGPAEQFNLLYAITFLRQSEADDVADTLRSDANGGKLPSPVGRDMQRPVAIVIRGRPFDFLASTSTTLDDAQSLAYPTQTFRSRWNCVLDLSSAGHTEAFEVSSEPPSTRDALPAPASPFPVASPKTARFPLDKAATVLSPTQAHAVAGSKRHTIGGLTERGQRMAPVAPYRASTSILSISNPNESPISAAPMPLSAVGGRFTPTPPSVAITPQSRFASPFAGASNMLSSPGPRTPGTEFPPPTPAYPAYPSEVVPPTPAAQSPISSLRTGGGAGPAIEPRRERMAQSGTPQTPGPRVPGASFTDRMTFENAEGGGDPVVVSVGLVPPAEFATSDLDMIYALDTFVIEIFVFNRSERTRRFEVSYPDRKRRRQQVAAETYSAGDTRGILEQRQAPGILPLENRIRVGPLRPHTCQSVRMQFLALQPGVHSIHSLTLMDVQTGYSMNLKSVMDVVVHEADET